MSTLNDEPTDLRSPRVLFRPAVREQIPLRIGLAGPTGSGKTLGALRLAYPLAGEDWSRVFMINTEPKANALGYVNDPDFEIGQYFYYQLEAPYNPKRLLFAMRNSVDSGAGAIIVDTFSMIWAGRGGVRDIHDNMTGNPFANWAKVNPLWDEMIDYLTYECPVHVIACLRSQLKYMMETYEVNGKTKTDVVLLGMAPILRPESEYEFPLFMQLDRETHRAKIITMRGGMIPAADPALDRVEITFEMGHQLRQWAETGEPWDPGEAGTMPAQLGDRRTSQRRPRSGANGQPQGMDTTLFWKEAYKWGDHKRLTTSEVREEVARIQPEVDNDAIATLAVLFRQWEIPQDIVTGPILDLIDKYYQNLEDQQDGAGEASEEEEPAEE